jgi:hypothetical protein
MPFLPVSAGKPLVSWIVVVLAAIVAGPANPLLAQEREVVLRGRVLDDRGAGLEGAEVVVTRAPDLLKREATTGAAGDFSITTGGHGDFLLQVVRPGWRSYRKRIAGGTDTIRVPDVKMTRLNPIELEGITVRGERRMVPQRGRGLAPEVGGGELIPEDLPAATAPEQFGDLLAAAGTVPGVSPAAGGVSILGLGPEQSSLTVNGLAFGSIDMPRGVFTSTRVVRSSYDPARGGFSGGLVAVEIPAGTSYRANSLRATFDAPVLQAGGPFAATYAQPFTGARLEWASEGEARRDRVFYTSGLVLSRRRSPAVSLAAAGAEALEQTGLSADSVARFLGILSGMGVPVEGDGGRRYDEASRVSFIGRLDNQPRTGAADRSRSTWGLMGYGQWDGATAYGNSASAASLPALDRLSTTGGLQGEHSAYLAKHYLVVTKSALSYADRNSSPSVQMPAGHVDVRSTLPDGETRISSLSFGGGGYPASAAEWSWQTTSETSWFSGDNRHRRKAYFESRVAGYRRTSAEELTGSYGYLSLADLEANQPYRFSRALVTPSPHSVGWNGAAAFADQWRPRRDLQLLAGLRLEANRFFTRPARNQRVLDVFGARTDRLPNSVHASPRLGFTWVFDPEGRHSVAYTELGRRQSGPAGVLSGGIGEFRNLLQPSALAEALAATGLEDGARSLLCLGPAVPVPDWGELARGAAALPEACRAQSAPHLGDSLRTVHLLAGSHAPPRSWRGNLAWTSSVGDVRVTVEGIYSLNLDQPSRVDLNFAADRYFVLPEEGGRRFFGDPGAVAARGGAAAGTAARLTPELGSVFSHRSDLRSRTAQLNLSVTPDLPLGRSRLGLAYSLTTSRAQFRGFDGGALDDPATPEWAPGELDVRHQLTLLGGLAFPGVGTFTLFSRIASGAPYTPVVAGDVNGDGVSGDRAYVFAPERIPDPAAAAAMRSLLRDAPEGARECLQRQLGTAAARNSCRGPWTGILNARIDLAERLFGSGSRTRGSIHVTNLLGGLDRVLHGGEDLRGWGGAASPEPVLLRVRGFDERSRQFSYDVNPRFGGAAPAALRAPSRITLDVSMTLGKSVSQQRVERALEPGRPGGAPGGRRSGEQLAEMFQWMALDLYAMVLAADDELLLGPEQVAALTAAREAHMPSITRIVERYAAYLAALPERYDAAEAVRVQTRAMKEIALTAHAEVPHIKEVLAPVQYRALPEDVRRLMEMDPAKI